MALRVDPLRQMRPVPADDLAARTFDHPSSAGPLAYDVYRTGDRLVIEFDVPGVEPAAVDVGVEDRTLVVSIRRELAQGSGVDVIEAGRQHGVFSQRLFLGDRWDLEQMDARARNGVLVVSAPVAQHATRRRLPVADGTQERPVRDGRRVGSDGASHDTTGADDVGAPQRQREPAHSAA